jgi:8-amino-7-oxononanoate synthase
VCAASIAALDLIEKEPDRRARLWRNRNHLLNGIRHMGFDTLGSETPILPILIPDSVHTQNFAQVLFDQGILAPAIRPPTVPKGASRIRLTVMSDHTPDDLDRVLAVLKQSEKKWG